MTAVAPNRTFAGRKSQATARILIVDDHPVVRQGLRMALSRHDDLEVCGDAAGENAAIQQFRKLAPDLVIVDMSLENGTGLELIKELKAIRRDARILVWSVYDESLFAERAVRAGAMGYLNKSAAIDSLVYAIRRILKGDVYLSEWMTNRMLRRTMGASNGEEQTVVDALSDRELEVFQEIGQGVTTRQIAAKLGLSPKTIETYRANIKSKLNLANSTQLTRRAVQWALENS